MYLQIDEALKERKLPPRLCCNPSSDEWTSLKAFKSLPAPQSGHVTTIMEGKVCTNLCRGWIVICITANISLLTPFTTPEPYIKCP